MKILKLKKTEYTNLESLLLRAGLVDKKNNTANPDRIFVNEATYREIKKQLKAEYRKTFSHLSDNKIIYSVNAYLLNLGPRVLNKKNNGDAIANGFAIVKD